MSIDRRDFFKTAGAGVAAAGLALTPGLADAPLGAKADAMAGQAPLKPMSEADKLYRIAACSYPIRSIFKNRGQGGGQQSQELKKQYGEITMLDFPQWTKDTFPGVTHMDIFSGLMGDITDDTMFVQRPTGGPGTFDPSTPSGRKWLEKLAAKQAATGVKTQHISNNAPTNLASPDDALRKAGVDVGKKWLDGAAIIGAKSVRMNSPQALGPSIRPNALTSQEQQAKGLRGDGYVRNFDIIPLLDKAIESYKEMADHGGNLGIKVTFENHWGLAADPMNIRIMLDTINHPYCEASPDFCNWEHEYMLFNGLKALAPYSHTNVHAKYWDRWGDLNDVQRSTRVMLAGGFKGTFALEYEAGPLNGIEGAKYLFKEVMAALSSPVPAI
jgi:sugar phosphate isomerase/epimerase